jgi:hypothetical protein
MHLKFLELKHALIFLEEEKGGSFTLFSIKKNGFEIICRLRRNKQCLCVLLRKRTEKIKEINIKNFIPLKDDYFISE